MSSLCATFVLGVDVVTYVQVQVRDLEMVGRLAHVVGAEQPGHARRLVGGRRRLLGAHLLGRGGRRRHLVNKDDVRPRLVPRLCFKFAGG